MYVRELNANNLEENLTLNQWILLNIYENNDIMSELSIATIVNVRQNINQEILVAAIEKKELIQYLRHHEHTQILMPTQIPQILLIKNGEIYQKIPGFCRVGKIVDIIREKVA